MAYFTSLNRIILFIVVAITVVAIAGGSWLLLSGTDDYAARMSQEFQTANDLMFLNDADAAVRAYDRLLGETKEIANRETLLLYKAFTLFQKEDQESKAEAVDMLGVLVQGGSDSLVRSWAVSLLLQFYYNTQSPEVLSMIKSLEVFSDMADLPNDSFLESLAEYGDSIEPTALGKIHLATPLARRLTYGDGIDDAERIELASRIEGLAVGSGLLEDNETIFDSPLHHMMLAHYRGIVLTAAVSGGTDPVLAEAQFQKAIALSNSVPENIAMRYLSAYSHFYYASLAAGALNDQGKARSELVNLMSVLEDGNVSEVFAPFVSVASQNPNSLNYQSLQKLADIDGTFATFLAERYGVNFVGE